MKKILLFIMLCCVSASVFSQEYTTHVIIDDIYWHDVNEWNGEFHAELRHYGTPITDLSGYDYQWYTQKNGIGGFQAYSANPTVWPSNHQDLNYTDYYEMKVSIIVPNYGVVLSDPVLFTKGGSEAPNANGFEPYAFKEDGTPIAPIWTNGVVKRWTGYKWQDTHKFLANDEFLKVFYQPTLGEKFHRGVFLQGGDIKYRNYSPYPINPTGYNTFHFHHRSQHNATVRTFVYDNPTGSYSIDVKDPWLENVPGVGGESYSLGEEAVFNPVYYDSQNPYNLGINTTYRGVFLNQSNPNAPRYTVRAPVSPTVSGYPAHFLGWSTSNATLSSPTNIVGGYYESPVVFTGSNASVTAKYKAYQASASPYTMSSTNQRKLAVLTLSGTTTHHLVYESGGEIWYASSTNGAAWTNEVLVSAGSGNNLNPSLDVYNVSNTVFVNVVWVNTSNSTVYFRQKTNSTWTSQEAVPVSEPTPAYNPSSWYPVTAHGYVAYNRYYSSGSGGAIVVKNRQSYNNWQNAGPVPGSGASSKNPSVVYGSTGHCHVAFEHGGVIKYNKVIYTGGSSYAWISTEQVSPTGWVFNSDPSLTLQYGPGGNPAVAWQSFGNVSGGSSVHVRVRVIVSGGVWQNVVQSYSYFNQASMRPTLGSLVNSFALSVMWYNSATQTIVRGTYNGSSWSSPATVASGSNSGSYPNMTAIGPSHSTSRVVWRKNTTWPLSYASTGMTPPPPDPKIVGGDEESIGKVQYSVVEATTEYDVIDDAEPLPYVWSRTGLIDLAEAIEAADEMNYEGKSEGPPSGTIGFELTGIALGSEQIPFSIVTDTAEQTVRYSSKPFVVSGATELTIAGNVSGSGLNLPSQLFTVGHSPLAKVVAKKVATGEEVKAVAEVPFVELENVEAFSYTAAKSYSADLSALVGEEIYLEVTMLGESGGGSPVIVDNYLIEDQPSNNLLTEEQIEEKGGQANPTGFVLHQNYPNPFNPETEIGFTVPEQSFVSITIMDILGREVAELGSRSYSPGTGRVRWDGTDKSGSKVGSGMYFYRISAVGESGRQFNEIKRMLLLK